MPTRTISIRVSDQAARAYESASANERRQLDALLSLRLAETTRSARPLEDVLTEISRNAQERGLTPEILSEILDAED